MGSKSSVELWIQVLKFINGKETFTNKELLDHTKKDRTAILRITNALIKADFHKVVKIGREKHFFETSALENNPALNEKFKELKKKESEKVRS